ncbi:zeta toxin family protein [Stenotrophomonas sp. PD6]|uniref:zeta toxin family protein n=1 Tax=Stenotrophomonas sp. PD6 TaxID=3368612 RepID=UPI003B9E8D14
MTDIDCQLSRQESDLILVEQIIPDYRLDDIIAYDRPKVIIVAGQPGACAAKLVRELFVELQGDAVLIDPEDLADYHPLVRRLRRDHPHAWTAHTATDALIWAIRLMYHTASLMKHVILDLSFTDGSLVSRDLVKAMKDRGYAVEVRAVAAHRLESEIALHVRFVDGMANEGYGRYISKAVHDSAYELLPERLNAIQGR